MQAQHQEVLTRAQQLLQQQNFAAAADLLAPVAQRNPGEPGVVRLLGLAQLRSGDVATARQTFQHLVSLVPNESDGHKDLGVALASLGELDAALGAFDTALGLDPNAHLARLHRGRTLERLGREDEAVLAYFGAIHRAQDAGRWLSDATTPPLLRDLVRNAMSVVDAGRRRMLDKALEPVVARHGAGALERVEVCLANFLGEISAPPADAAQRPLFLYFPGLPSQRYFERELFPWLGEFEAQAGVIRAELQQLMQQDGGFVPFLGNDTPEQVADQLVGTRGEPAWNAFFFYRHGERYEDNCRRCPQTAAILDKLPLARIREHAPEICFSVLTPGSHILPHTGVTNTRVVCHLPLIVPEECALVVGGETHVWQEGRCVVFDDTFEHEAWNRSESLRVVLLMDLWNPHLSEAERDAMGVLVGAIGDFNAAAGLT
jgi:aspartate beta-hydroxylase